MILSIHGLCGKKHQGRIPLYELLEKGPLSPVAAGPAPTPLDDQRLAEYLHFRYGRHARQEGAAATKPPVPFHALPDAHKRTLLLLAQDIQVLLTRVKQEGFVQGKEHAFDEAL
jgi:hypothetical protein